MVWVKVKNAPVNATIEVTVPVNNADGSIATIKAFVVGSYDDFAPLGNCVSFPQ